MADKASKKKHYQLNDVRFPFVSSTSQRRFDFDLMRDANFHDATDETMFTSPTVHGACAVRYTGPQMRKLAKGDLEQLELLEKRKTHEILLIDEFVVVENRANDRQKYAFASPEQALKAFRSLVGKSARIYLPTGDGGKS